MLTKAAPKAPTQALTLPPPGAGLLDAASSRYFRRGSPA